MSSKINEKFRFWYSNLPMKKRKKFLRFIFAKVFIDEPTIEKKRVRFHNVKYGRSPLEGLLRNRIFKYAAKMDSALVSITDLFPEYELSKIQNPPTPNAGASS